MNRCIFFVVVVAQNYASVFKTIENVKVIYAYCRSVANHSHSALDL